MVKTFFANIGLAFAYFFTAYFSIEYFSWQDSNSCPVWPASGLALGVLLAYPRRILWPGVYIGAFLANSLTLPDTGIFGTSGFISLGIALGNTGEAVVGAQLMLRWSFSKDHRHVREFLLFLTVPVVACMASAVNGPLWLWYWGQISVDDMLYVMGIWWVGDYAGVLIGMPVVWCLLRQPTLGSSLLRQVEAVVFLAAVARVVFLTFHWNTEASPLAFLSVCMLCLAPFRYSSLTTALGVVIVATGAVFSTAQGIGPFSSSIYSGTGNLLLLELFLMSVVVVIQALSTACQERQIVLQHLKQEVEHKTATLQKTMSELDAVKTQAIAEAEFYKQCLPDIETLLEVKQNMEGIQAVREMHDSVVKLIDHLQAKEG